jgi:hypothetical protein
MGDRIKPVSVIGMGLNMQCGKRRWQCVALEQKKAARISQFCRLVEATWPPVWIWQTEE